MPRRALGSCLVGRVFLPAAGLPPGNTPPRRAAAAQKGRPTILLLLLPVLLHAQDWPVYGRDAGGSRYSPLDQINRANVAGLKLAWKWKTGEKAFDQFKTTPGNFQATPLMIDGVLYLSTPYNRVVALDAESGRELWAFDPKSYEDGQPPNGTGFVHRGVAAWRDGGKLRILINSRYRLVELDA